jgi:hypothetical protein
MSEELEGLPEAVVPQVQQWLAERANADALGQEDQVDALDRQLSQYGYEKGKAAKKRAKAAEDEPEAKTELPKGRSAPKPSSTG